MYLLGVDSGELRQLPSSDFIPSAWFPDGNHMLVEGRGSHSGLWKMSAADGTSRKLSDGGGPAAISPDGTHIAYEKTSLVPEIWLTGADGEKPRRIAEFGTLDVLGDLAWSPGGQRLVYIRRRGDLDNKPEIVIETCDLQGGQRTPVLSEPRLWSTNGGLSDVYWLPDGRILYRSRGPVPYSDSEIWLMGADGEKPHRIAEFDALDVLGDLAWSRGGQRLVYIRRRGDLDNKLEAVIETCDLQGGPRIPVLSEPRLWSTKAGLSDVY